MAAARGLGPKEIRGFGRPEVGRAATTGVTLARCAGRVLVGRQRVRSADRSAGAARELKVAFAELGPTYVKLAQLVASSPGLFPQTLADEFRSLLDEVPPIQRSEVHRVLTEELGAAPDEVFDRFDDEPLASASIAQVHTARLQDGEEVVVKIQRPGIRARLESDLRILVRIAAILDRVSKKGRMANPTAVVEDFAATLSEELNFVNEAHSMERYEANLRSFGTNDGVRVPSVRWAYTTPRVLTMERIYGFKIDDLAQLGAQGWDLAGALKRGVRAWMESALEHGFFHGDVHAGNLMLDQDGNVTFLDFGIVGRLDDSTREIIRHGLPALLIEGDFVKVAEAIYQMGAVLSPKDLEQSSRDIARIVQPILGRPLSEISYGQVLIDIVRVGTTYDVRLPRELVLVAKQMLYFERYAKLMAPDWAILNDPDLIGFLFEGLETAVVGEASPEPAPERGGPAVDTEPRA